MARAIIMATIYTNDFISCYTEMLVTSSLPLAWCIMMVMFSYISSGVIYVSYAIFDLLGAYFRLRYERLIDGAEMIACDSNIPKDDRNVLMDWILTEHNVVCVSLHRYNWFWSKYVAISYSMLTFITMLSLYQVFPTVSTFIIMR